MFDIGFPELLLVAVVMLLVLGPERLPEALRTAGLWIGRLQRSFTSVKTEIEREIGMDDIRRQLHNESVMAEMRKLEQDLKKSDADPRLNGRLGGAADGNSILPEDSLGLDTAADNSGTAATPAPAAAAGPDDVASTESTAAPALSEGEVEGKGEAAMAEQQQQQHEAAAGTTDSEPKTSGDGGSKSDDEQRA